METTVNRIIEYPVPIAAVTALRRIQKEVPEAIVAGGCLRDTINGKPVNDIDIFVPQSRGHVAREVISEGRRLTKVIPEPYLTFNNAVSDVRYYEGNGELPVNIISVTDDTCTPEQQLDRFDFGICRVAYDGVRLWKDLTFDRDQREHTFTLLVAQTKEQRKYSLERFKRLQEKYPGWKMVACSPKPDAWDL